MFVFGSSQHPHRECSRHCPRANWGRHRVITCLGPVPGELNQHHTRHVQHYGSFNAINLWWWLRKGRTRGLCSIRATAGPQMEAEDGTATTTKSSAGWERFPPSAGNPELQTLCCQWQERILYSVKNDEFMIPPALLEAGVAEWGPCPTAG